MDGIANLQILPDQTGAAVHAASVLIEQPPLQDTPAEASVSEGAIEPSDDGLVKHAPAEHATTSEQSRFLSLAAVLTSDRNTFLDALDHAVGGAVTRAAAHARSEPGTDAPDESAAFERIVASLVADRATVPAVVVGAALAARTVGQALFRTENEFDVTAAEALLEAWLDAARALLGLRGIEGLLRLVPAARNLARRAAEHHDVAPAIAEAMRRVAARIAETEPSLRPQSRRWPERQERVRLGNTFDLPRRIVVSGQLQLVFHAY